MEKIYFVSNYCDDGNTVSGDGCWRHHFYNITGSISIVSSILSNGISITEERNGTILPLSFIDNMKHFAVIWARL